MPRVTAWQIAFDGYDPEDEHRREALLALGNGVLSCRASAPEASATRRIDSHYPGLYRSGWYDDARRRVNRRIVHIASLVNLPDPFGLSVAIEDGAWFTPRDIGPEYRQWLDLRHGILHRRFRLTLSGTAMLLEESRFVSMAMPSVAFLRWTLRPKALDRTLRLRATLDGAIANRLIARHRAYEGRRLQTTDIWHDDEGHAAIRACLPESRRRVMVAVSAAVHSHPCRWTGRVQGDCIVQECSLPNTGVIVIEKRVAVCVDDEIPDEAGGSEVLRCVPDAPSDHLEAMHAGAWRQLWKRVSLRTNDANLGEPLHFAMAHILQTVSPLSIGRDQGFPPRGWQEGYFGQIFWDEIFAFPFLATHFPELARNLLRYRYSRLDEARDQARLAGLRGAMFPWRSARDGGEETPPFQCNPLSGRWMHDHTALQRHVGAAVAYDVWQLYLATGDRALLAGCGGEMILEVARFWVSLARYEPQRGRYCIRGVIGPDEYHNAYPDADRPGLDNNAYTNLMAVWTLCRALDVLSLLRDGEARTLRKRLDIGDSELAQWDDVSRRMYLPLLDEGVLSQFEGYERLLRAPSSWLSDDRPRLDWMLEARHDSSDRYQLTKQADVLTLLHLFPPAVLCDLMQRLGYAADDEFHRRTADYHLARITHESSLSKMVCAGATAHLDRHRSWQYFCDAIHTDLDAAPHSGVREGVHLGAMAGSLDVLQRHYLGLWPGLDGLHVLPSPPDALDGISIAIDYRGTRIHVALAGHELRIGLDSEAREDVVLFHGAGATRLAPGRRVTLDARRADGFSGPT